MHAHTHIQAAHAYTMFKLMFTHIHRVQQELMETDKKKKQEGASKRAAHAEEVRRQVRKKEEERIAARRGFFEEGIKLDQEARERSDKHPKSYHTCLKHMTLYMFARGSIVVCVCCCCCCCCCFGGGGQFKAAKGGSLRACITGYVSDS